MNDTDTQRRRLWIRLFYGLNILVALVIGLSVLVRYRPDGILARVLDPFRRFLVWGLPNDAPRGLHFLRDYLPGMLFSYALTFAVSAALRKKRRTGLAVEICCAAVFLLEAAQLLPFVPGAFDPGDLILEAVGVLVAGAAVYAFEWSLTRPRKPGTQS